jgi:hypothetical protein
MQRTQFIFIDYENVAEADLARITGKPVRVFMIIGARHKKLPVSLFLFAQDHPEQVRIIHNLVEGRNALDMVLSLELGRILAGDPHGYFHIVAKDTDYESVVLHLKAEKRLIARHPSLSEIPALFTKEERMIRLRTELCDPDKPRPSSRKALANKIRTAFDYAEEPEIVEKTILEFMKEGILSFTEADKVSYKAA